MKFSVKTIAKFLKGEIVGDPNITVDNFSKIEEGLPGTLSFLANPKYTEFIYKTKASVVIVNRSFTPTRKIKPTLIKVDDAYQAIAALLELQETARPEKLGISSLAFMDSSVKYGKSFYLGEFAYIGKDVHIGDHVKIYPHVYIGEKVQIKDHSIIYPGVKIYDDCIIGKNAIIHAGAVIGSDGFGFAPGSSNDYKKVPQTGNVILNDNVEIGANTTIDRATMGSTIIGKGVKLDNLVQIAHNVNVGDNTVMAAQSGIAGSTKVGRDCMFGGQVGITGHVEIADKVKAAAQSGIAAAIRKEGLVVQGSPSYSLIDYQRSYVYYKKLPSLVARLEALEKKILELK